MSENDTKLTGGITMRSPESPEAQSPDAAIPRPAYARLSININSETEDVLKRYKGEGKSLTETVRRAVALLDMLDREHARGSRIQLVDAKGAVRELIMFM